MRYGTNVQTVAACVHQQDARKRASDRPLPSGTKHTKAWLTIEASRRRLYPNMPPTTTGPPASLRVAVTSRLAPSFDLNTNIRSSTDGMGSHRIVMMLSCFCFERVRISSDASSGRLSGGNHHKYSHLSLRQRLYPQILARRFLAAWILVQTIRTEISCTHLKNLW